jgi:hypothetical protein
MVWIENEDGELVATYKGYKLRLIPGRWDFVIDENDRVGSFKTREEAEQYAIRRIDTGDHEFVLEHIRQSDAEAAKA